MKPKEALLRRLKDEPGVLVSVDRTQGSAPREAGAWMAVFADAVIGTVGGGQLEFQAMAQARAMLVAPGGAADQPAARSALVSPSSPAMALDNAVPSGREDMVLRYPLGPSLGQCCGGVMHLRYEFIEHARADALAQRLREASMPVALFGGGHVGHALARLLGDLPCDVAWIDSRDGIFPSTPPGNVVCEFSDPVQSAVRDLRSGSHVLIMSFSHAEDLDILAECLRRQREKADLASIGLIGSKSKWAAFRHRLEARGFTEAELQRVTSPIGVPGLLGKEPEVIALAVAAQLMQQRGSPCEKPVTTLA